MNILEYYPPLVHSLKRPFLMFLVTVRRSSENRNPYTMPKNTLFINNFDDVTGHLN